ncbi:unnamed protein product [Zymoseptoria tritici ST99CH_1E4]|uniref:Acyltransferase 3 domain-containing protein n=1 Tax=Zymoseptoria tritici ST99CH_1E4 TaxID=1276532 RepID=A0A2H1GHL2_ZYMTR|nr:unnamed protein product [Zymoseptoria tritici ST99CH_1E4]
MLSSLLTYASKPWSILCLLLHRLTIIFPRRLRPAHNLSHHELHPTAYLDAVRGFAAWIVYNGHIFNHKPYQPTAWPQKLFFDGIAMVDLFFVISGFALSFSILGAVHRGNTSKAYDSLASSVFRRYIRLYLPTAFATFVGMLVIASGLGIYIPGERDTVVPQPTFLGNLWFWVKDTAYASNPFVYVVSWYRKGKDGTRSYYAAQLWTIPVEFQGSMIVFAFCAAVCKMKPWARTLTMWVGMAACFWWQTMYGGLFLAGMWLADRRQWRAAQESKVAILPTDVSRVRSTAVSEATPLAVIEEESNEKDEEGKDTPYADDDDTTRSDSFTIEEPQITPRPSRWQTWLAHLSKTSRNSPNTPQPTLARQIIHQIPSILLFFISLYILTAGPTFIDSKSPFPFNLIAHTVPPTYTHPALQHWPTSLGSILCIYSLESSPLLRRPFESSFAQFIGELSFGIYAMHITVRWILWERAMLKWTRMYFGKLEGRFWPFVPAYLVMTFATIWAAEGFRRVDGWCVWLSKWLKEKCFAG